MNTNQDVKIVMCSLQFEVFLKNSFALFRYKFHFTFHCVGIGII